MVRLVTDKGWVSIDAGAGEGLSAMLSGCWFRGWMMERWAYRMLCWSYMLYCAVGCRIEVGGAGYGVRRDRDCSSFECELRGE